MARTGASSGLAISCDAWRVREQGVHAGAVQVFHAGQVHDDPAALRGGLAEGGLELVRVAHVDLTHRGHHRDPVRAATGGELKRGGHG